MHPLVSILINNYNYGRFLRQAIDSALNQSYRECEVVVVDDGSTDDSVNIIRSYGNRIHPVLKNNGGQASAINAGFGQSRGEIIMFLDADDYLAPTAAERIVSSWNDEVDILHHRLQVVDANGNEAGFAPPRAIPLDAGDASVVLLRHGRYIVPPTSGLAYRRGLLEKILPMPEQEFRICADTFLTYKAAFLAPVTILGETLAFYRVHGENAVGNVWPDRWTSRRKLEQIMNSWDLGHILLKQQAAERGVVITETPFAWEASMPLRCRLILLRLAGSPAGSAAGRTLVQRIGQKLRVEGYTPINRLRQNLLAVAIWLAPRPLLRRLFPNIF